MKRIVLGSTAVAVLGIAAFFGSGMASATTLCKESKASGDCLSAWPVGVVLNLSVETSNLLKTTGGTVIFTCTEGVIKGTTSNAGGTTQTVSVGLGSFGLFSCNTTVNTLAAGSLEIHQISGTNSGTVTSTGAEGTVNFLGVSCVFRTSATDIGTLTGGSPSTLDLNGRLPIFTGGLCPKEGIWSGADQVTEPTTTVDVAAG